jgi:hypothetical protein
MTGKPQALPSMFPAFTQIIILPISAEIFKPFKYKDIIIRKNIRLYGTGLLFNIYA